MIKNKNINYSTFKAYKRVYLFVKPNSSAHGNIAASTLQKWQAGLIKTGTLKKIERAKFTFWVLIKTLHWKLKTCPPRVNNYLSATFVHDYYILLKQRLFSSGVVMESKALKTSLLLQTLQFLFCKNQNSVSKNTRILLKTGYLQTQVPPLWSLKNRLANAINFKFRNFFFLAKTRRLRPENVAKFAQFESALKWGEARRFLLYLHRHRSSDSVKEKAFKWAFFKKLFKKWLKRYRHIQKNKLFLSIFKAMFTRLTATHEKKLQSVWNFFRKFKKRVGGKSGLTFFSRYIFMRPELLLVLLGLAPNKKTGRLYASSGICAINGLVGNLLSDSLIPGDICQISPILWQQAKMFQNYFRWDFVKTRLNRFSFIQVDWSICAFIVIKWPKGYELAAPKFLTERWLRYYVRNLPVRKRKPQKFKMFWKGYEVSFIG